MSGTDAHSATDLAGQRASLERMARILLFALGLAVFASLALVRIEGAVMAGGVVVRAATNSAVAHPDGGPVREVHVANGDTVEAGDLLVSLEGRELRATTRRLERERLTHVTRLRRLRAGLEGTQAFTAPGLRGRHGAATGRAEPSGPAESDVARTQFQLFRADMALLRTRKARLEDRIEGLGREIGQVKAQIATTQRRIGLLEDEIATLADLVDQQLLARSQLTALKRERLSALEQRDRLHLRRVELENARSDARAEHDEIDRKHTARIWKEIERSQAALAETEARLETARIKLDRLEITAPVSGRVHDMQIESGRDMVMPGDVVMHLVPSRQAATLRVRIAPSDIDQIHRDQAARVRFDTLDPGRPREFRARLERLSPDSARDPATGQVYYEAILSLDEAARARIGELDAPAGLPVTTYFPTRKRSLLGYLAEPLHRSVRAAFRDG